MLTQVTNHAFDRQTDGQTDTFLVTTCSPGWHFMQRGKNYKSSLLSVDDCSTSLPNVVGLQFGYLWERRVRNLPEIGMCDVNKA